MIDIKSRKLCIIVLIILALGLGAQAAPKPETKPAEAAKPSPSGLELKVEKKGTYVFWFTYTDANGGRQVTVPGRFKGGETEIDKSTLLPGFKNAKLYVMDKKTGNEAIVDYVPPKDAKAAEPIDLSKDDFNYIRNVDLNVTSEDGAPLERGMVSITDGDNNEQSTVVTPADEGVARFTDVAAGEVNVKVSAEGAKRTIDSDIELPTNRETPGFVHDVKVSGDVDTLKVSASSAAKPKTGRAASAPRQSPLAGIFQFLTGVIFLVIVVAVVAIVLRAKGVNAKKTLQSMGVEFPGDQAAAAGAPTTPAAPAVDPSVCQFCGQKKDANGNCACTVAPGASPFAAPAAASSGPRLVGSQGAYSGHIFEITGSSAVIGREADNPVALPNDSTASRRHATITVSNGEYFIRDEGSSNGTFVNGARITEQKLAPGDEVQIGGTKFRFEV